MNGTADTERGSERVTLPTHGDRAPRRGRWRVLYGQFHNWALSMNGRSPTRDGSESTLSQVRTRLGSVDRGWKATLVGVVLALLYAVGVV